VSRMATLPSGKNQVCEVPINEECLPRLAPRTQGDESRGWVMAKMVACQIC
jgi:hypothetical protein